ncbi:MAG TPA: hypothetical protein PKA27_15670 [Fimbriimonadaceae bacterium]|nr:hypothetical protein [Fimbriimonadaceae bacterium]
MNHSQPTIFEVISLLQKINAFGPAKVNVPPRCEAHQVCNEIVRRIYELNRTHLRRSVQRGLEEKVRSGWFPGRAPLGYVNNPKTRHIDPDRIVFPLLKEAWEQCLAGRSIADVEATLRASCSAPLNLRSVLSNPFYAGYFRFRDVVVPGKHLPMVTGAQFSGIQERLRRDGKSAK